MKPTLSALRNVLPALGLVLFFFAPVVCVGQRFAGPREADFNFGWKFHLGEVPDAQAPNFNDTAWRDLRLPHDWSVEASFDKEKGEGATGYLPGGIGWYRKSFAAPAGDAMTFVCFDGIYNNAEIWINGTKLGFHPYGYTAFSFDLTPHLKPGPGNVLAVRVDRTRFVDSRWYPGSGIYRAVKLVTVDPLHVPIWGIGVTTPAVSAQEAQVAVEIQVRNARAAAATFELATEILDPAGRSIGQFAETRTLAAGAEGVFNQRFRLSQPALWDLERPQLHRAVTTVRQGAREVDRLTTVFGLRSFRFDPNEGFFLNGVNRKIKGVCLHHDGGLVGAAVPADVWRRRFAALKAGGCNSIRVSHNPASAEFLDLCDEMGLLVQEEFFDEWDYPKDKRLNKEERIVDAISRGYGEHFQAWAERDLKATVRRDRNHPSIIQWSIGNEIEWTYPAYSKATGFFEMTWQGNYFWSTPPNPPERIRELVRAGDNGTYTMAATAKKLAAWTREMDLTRPIILNCILPEASHESGVTDALDIVGYSYRRVVYDYGHRNYPDKPIMGTENLPQWHEWKAVMERPFICGTFLWTGIDYMGESHKGWPRKATKSGLLDLGGFPKASYHMLKTLWAEEPHVFVATQLVDKSPYKLDAASGKLVEKKPGGWEHALWVWHSVNPHWNYEPASSIAVEAYSNCEEVELFLNARSLGKQRPADCADRILKWAVPFEAGRLVARGQRGGQTVEAELATSGTPAALAATVDRPELPADGYAVAHVVVQILDAKGLPVRCEERRISFEVEGDGRVLGVDNGAAENVQDYQARSLVTAQGRCLLIVQANRQATVLKITAKSDGLQAAMVTVPVR